MLIPEPAPVGTNKKRTFITPSLVVKTWDSISGYYNDLREREIKDAADLRLWLSDRSELESMIQEDLAWRYIHMSCDTSNKEYSDAFNFFVSEIEPNIAPFTNALNEKLLNCPNLNELNDSRMEIMLRNIRKQVEIFREENIPLFAELQQKEQHFATIAGAMTIEVDGKEVTLQQAANYLKNNNRQKREAIYKKIVARRLADREALDHLFDELISLRHQIALNAGFNNFRDFMFAALGRFDYTPEDCFNFHKAIADEIVPLTNQIMEHRKKTLGYDELKPWDIDVDVSGNPALKPFNGSDDMIDKTIKCFSDIHPFLGNCIETLRNLKHIDLESRIGKAPGGFNYPLYETGVPFIFMNSTNSLRDLVTIVHEGGHAVHSILTKDLDYVEFRSTPSEVAELASMSMELLSMEHWDFFFNNPEELKSAKIQHIEKMIESIPWIAAIDKFQHWIYTNPKHTAADRKKAWHEINTEFSGNVVNWEGQEEAFDFTWQKQLHLYQVPFYYIEYGMAQLGAIAIWRNYQSNQKETLEAYFNALKLGYTAPIGAIYKAAGISFDFSLPYIKELSGFLKKNS
ncbi:MAG: M3 family oligoendopeptidase [Bacteroidetes bacterium]|nr:M3 family oligoendopeptidase [Bacteroidota bacterium]